MINKMPKNLTIRANINGDLRTAEFNGQKHIVVPVTALVQGVLQGLTAKNAELALASEFGKCPAGWNGRPVMVNHPVVNKQLVSANSAEVLESFCIGQLFNTSVKDNKLITEAWINIDKANSQGSEGQQIVDMLGAGQMIEVSTGLFCENKPVKGTYNGKSFDGQWSNIVPDHLALLPNQVGACSIEDGCGALQSLQTLKASRQSVEIKSTGTGECACEDKGACQCNTQQKANASTTIESEGTRTDVATWNYTETYIYRGDEDDPPIANATANTDKVGIIKAFTDLLLGGNKPTITYTGENEMAETNKPTTNGEEDAPTKEATTTTTPETSTPKEDPPSEDQPTAAATKEEVSEEQFLASMPETMREPFQEGKRALDERRNEVITSITANKENPYTDEELKAMKLDDLLKLQKIAAPKAVYSGAAAGPRELSGNSDNTVPSAPVAFTKNSAKQSQDQGTSDPEAKH